MIPIGKKLVPKRCVVLSISHVLCDLIFIQGQTFTVIGAAGELPQPPPQPVVFLEGLVPLFIQSNMYADFVCVFFIKTWTIRN